MTTLTNLVLFKRAAVVILLVGLFTLTSCSRRKTTLQNYAIKQEILSVVNIKPPAIPTHNSRTRVSISGTGFKTGLSVYIGDTFCSNLQFVSSRELACTAPASAQESVVSVKVINPDSEVATLQNGFRYTNTGSVAEEPDVLEPVVNIAKVVPDNGPATGGTKIRILGKFVSGISPDALTAQYPNPGGMVVMLGADFCLDTNFNSPSELECTTPKGLGGPVNVTVYTYDNKASYVAARGFSYTPVLSDFDPKEGPALGGTIITIVGQGFGSVNKITVGDHQCAIKTSHSSLLQCVAPAGVGGTKTLLTVHNSDGLTVTFGEPYSYTRPEAGANPLPQPPKLPAPAITRVEPNVGSISVATRVVIHGSNFRGGVTASFNGRFCAIYSTTATTIDCLIPAGTGAQALKVVNQDGSSALLIDAFTHVPPPEVTLLVNGQQKDVILGMHENLTVSWDSRYATYCSVTNLNGNSDKWAATSHAGVGVAPGSFLSERQVRYELNCVGPAGSAYASRLVRRYAFVVGSPYKNTGAYLLKDSASLQACLSAATPSCAMRPYAAKWGTADALNYPNPSSTGPVHFMADTSKCRCWNNPATPLTYWTIDSTP